MSLGLGFFPPSYVFLTKLSHPILPLASFLFISSREFSKSLCMCTKEEDGGEGKLVVNLQINT